MNDPTWKMTLAAALAIVAAAVLAGWFEEGAGVAVVVAGTLGWTAFAIARRRRPSRR